MLEPDSSPRQAMEELPMAKKIVRTAGATSQQAQSCSARPFPRTHSHRSPLLLICPTTTPTTSSTTPATTPRNHLRCTPGSGTADLRCSRSSSAPAAETYMHPRLRPSRLTLHPLQPGSAAPTVSSTPGNTSRNTIITQPQWLGLGAPTVWGSKTFGTWDCSGFTS